MRFSGVDAGLAVMLCVSLAGCSSVAAGTSLPAAPPAPRATPPTGDGCSQISDNLDSMAAKPVASAIASNFNLSVLGGTLERTGLATSLNQAPALTVFAPTNAAFADMPSARFDAVWDNPNTLARTLKEHVVSGRLPPEQLPGTHRTLGGGEVTVENREGALIIDGNVRVTCANVQAVNAVLYVVDAVLDAD